MIYMISSENDLLLMYDYLVFGVETELNSSDMGNPETE